MGQSMAALTLLACFAVYAAVAQTVPSDKAALLELKASVQVSDPEFLASWDNSSDPCMDQWQGVSCSCYPFDSTGSNTGAGVECTPLAAGYDPSSMRVLQLNLGDVLITQWNTLSGPLPSAVGSLTALRVLNLLGNNLTGSIPWQWEQLANLEQLVLSQNQVSGSVPVFLSNLPRLRNVFLDNNNLTGGLPVDWCYGSWWFFDVRNNVGMCDEVPGCLLGRLLSFEGTSLVDTVSNRDGGMGGYCGVNPPTCSLLEDACIVLGPDPPYWTSVQQVTFSFPEFPSGADGGPAYYLWSIGTSPSAADAVGWRPFEGQNVTQSAEVRIDATGQTSIVSQVVHLVNTTLPAAVSLTQGGQYYVSVRGSNECGVHFGIVVDSDIVTVDATPPFLPPGTAVYSSQYFTNVQAQLDTAGTGVSWDPFVDPESNVMQYAHQVFEYVSNPDGDSHNGDGFTYVGAPLSGKVQQHDNTTRSVYIDNLTLTVGSTIFVRVFATNGAGTEAFVDAPPVAVVTPGQGITVSTIGGGVRVSRVVVLVAVLVGAVSATVALASFYLARERYSRRQQASHKQRTQQRTLRHLLNSLADTRGGPGTGAPLKPAPEGGGKAEGERLVLRDVAFVITDLQNSTGIASAAPGAYEFVQQAHDSLLRDLIAAHNGYEINTEGDAFHIAFQDVATAVHFCMEVQYQMMEVDWPREVLRLPECKEVRAPQGGGWSYRGPRVRMGVHWAEEGSAVQHVHALTKHRIYSGPAFQVTRDVCEAARGGQVLLTQAVWERLRGAMAAAAFPVVESLGRFKFITSGDPIWVYQVTHLLGQPFYRTTAGAKATQLGGGERVADGCGLIVTPVPVPRGSKGELAFVSCRLTTEGTAAAASGASLPSAVHTLLYELLASGAMQFGGYMFRLSESQGCYLLAFSSCVDAVRFCHASQTLLMYAYWPAEAAAWCGKEQRAGDGKLLFKGPRMAMAIHESNDYSTRPVPRPHASPDQTATQTDYVGPAEEVARVLSEVAHGGQVVLSESAWAGVQDQLPGQPQAISLGTHALEEPGLAEQPVMLMELMPQLLARRSFPPPQRTQMIEPGYRDAPGPGSNVAVGQVGVSKPREVCEAEAAAQGGQSAADDGAIRVLAAYNVALARYVACARSLLRAHGGYECKEPEPGKMTVAFNSLEEAVRWAAALQRVLLEVHWPKEVLEWGDCREVRDGEEEDGDGFVLKAAAASGGGPVLWRGLRVKVGLAVGALTSKAPLNTGRADYFGTMPNLAARLMSLAQPGQSLVDGARLGTLRTLSWRDDAMLLPGSPAAPEGLQLTLLGQFAVKGLEDLRTVYEVRPMGLAGRMFPESAAAVAASGHSISAARRLPSIRMLHEPFTATAGKTLHGGDSSACAGSPVASKQAKFAGARRPGIFSSISRSASVTGGTRSARLGSMWRSFSRHSESPDSSSLRVVHPQSHHPDATSGSATSSVAGGGAFTSWLARNSATLAPQVAPHSAAARRGGGGRDADAASAFTETPTSTTRPAEAARGEAAVGAVTTASVCSDSEAPQLGLGAAAASSTSQGPRLHISLRDVDDWSYPGSHVATPSAAVKAVDHWDVSLAVEAALKGDGLPGGAAQQRGAAAGGAAGGEIARSDSAVMERMEGGGGGGARGVSFPGTGALSRFGRGKGGRGGARPAASGGVDYARQVARLFWPAAAAAKASSARAASPGLRVDVGSESGPPASPAATATPDRGGGGGLPPWLGATLWRSGSRRGSTPLMGRGGPSA